jgi:glucose/arabinose dehydrogenase
MLFTERNGQLSRVVDGEPKSLIGLPDIYVRGESGLLGLTTDPEFTDNQFIYACYATDTDVRVSRWALNDVQLSNKVDIVTGMPLNRSTFPGRHSGCRVVFDQAGVLWVGTGDVAVGSNPQNPQSLGGKILRVDRDGNPVDGNLPLPFDPRIYNYGHRNVQGLALTRGGESFAGFSVEHGSDVDDEVNMLVSGNFGWDPPLPYDESVPMTDLDKFPDAVMPVWASGRPTLAPSGATMVYGDEWGNMSGNLFVAMQKTKHIRMFDVSGAGELGGETELFKNEFGRIRTVVQAPNGDVYFATDNGNGEDKIVKITPQNN